MTSALELLKTTVIDNPYIPAQLHGHPFPSPPQAYFLTLPHMEALYGGAAGGGKSAALMAAALQFVHVPDYSAILFRRTFTDLEMKGGLIEMSHDWLSDTDAEWDGQNARWHFPSGAALTFGYMQNKNDHMNYKGPPFQFCVGRGTRVRMAGGRLAAVQTIRAGDWVETLEGPRRVIRCARSAGRECWRALAWARGRLIGSQIQSADHCLYVGGQWVSVESLISIQSHFPGIPLGSNGARYDTYRQFREIPSMDRGPASAQDQSRPDRRPARATCVVGAGSNGESDCVAFDDYISGAGRPDLSTVPLVRISPFPHSAGRAVYPPIGARANVDGRICSSPPNSQECYLSGNRPYGARARPGPIPGLICPPRSFCAERPSPTRFVNDVPDRIRKRIRPTSAYAHPYTMEIRRNRLALSECEFSFEPERETELFDLTIDRAAHYITESGFINRNCGFDEATAFPENQALFMFSRLRRPTGMPVPLRWRGATNPGDRGAAWIKRRYGLRTINGETYARNTAERYFVPARLADNPGLDHAAYRASLAKLDAVTRAQMEAGNWSITPQGNMFRREWWRWYDRVPAGLELVRVWDLAATEPGPKNDDPDYTVGLKMGRDPMGNYYIVHLIRDRFTPGRVEEVIRTTAHADGRGVAIVLKEEPGSAGKTVSDHFARKVLPGFNFRAIHDTGPKIERARNLSAAAEHRLIYLPEGAAWVEEFLDEITPFPTEGVHDDQVDAAATAHQVLTGGMTEMEDDFIAVGAAG